MSRKAPSRVSSRILKRRYFTVPMRLPSLIDRIVLAKESVASSGSRRRRHLPPANSKVRPPNARLRALTTLALENPMSADRLVGIQTNAEENAKETVAAVVAASATHAHASIVLRLTLAATLARLCALEERIGTPTPAEATESC